MRLSKIQQDKVTLTSSGSSFLKQILLQWSEIKEQKSAEEHTDLQVRYMKANDEAASNLEPISTNKADKNEEHEDDSNDPNTKAMGDVTEIQGVL